MKQKIKYTIVLVFTTIFMACETNFEDPNAATQDQVYSSREGIFAATIGMQQVYATSGMRWIIETPAITTREAGITTTLQNMIELEEGGTVLPNFNSSIESLWSTLLRVMKMAEDIASSTGNISLEEGTKNGLIAYANLYKAICIGSLAQNFEQVIINTSNDNNAEFVSRIDGFNEAIRLLNEAKLILESQSISDEFVNEVDDENIDVLNTIKAMLARYNLFAGNYDAAIVAANSVDLTSKSEFVYDLQNLNPIWARILQNGISNFKPRDNFGLPNSFVFDTNDGRLSFYLVSLDENNQNGLPIEDIAGFFDLETKPIPIYLPDEMNLIIAEANLRKTSPDLAAATIALNKVLTEADVLGVNANVGSYSGSNTKEALLLEIYKNRRAELFLTGMSLEDSRRFNRPEPSGNTGVFTEERNRNFYPYPERERNSNPNTPNDPSI